MSDETLIENHLTEDGKIVDVSKEWNKERGLCLKIPAGLPTVGTYQGTLTWSLVDGPN